MVDSLLKARTIVHYSADLWEHVCPMQRVVEPAQRLGFELLHGNEWDPSSGELEIFPERVSEADLVVIQRDFPRHFEAYEEILRRARALRKPVLYEWDDMLTGLPAVHPDYDHYMSVRAAILTAILEADAVTCATPYLAEYTRQFNPNVWVLPNYLNDRLWELKPAPAEIPAQPPVILGYLGAHSHRPDLDGVTPVLERLLDEYGDRLRLQLWNIQLPAGLEVRSNVEEPWPGLVSYASFVDTFLQHTWDIGIAPLLDSEFNRGKSWQKFLEYSALGIPGVYSRLTPYETVVEDGVNGFLARSPSEWEACLRALIEDAPLRQQVGQAAQGTARQGWMLSGLAHLWEEAYTQAISLPVDSHRPLSTMARKFYGWDRETRARRQQERDEHSRALVEVENANQRLSQTIAQHENSLQPLVQRLAEADQRLAEADQAIQGLNQRLAQADQAIQGLQGQLTEKDGAIQTLHQEVEDRDILIQKIKGDLHETTKTLDAILGSTGWKLLERLYRLRLILAPRGSTRERWLHTAIKSTHALKTTGVGGFLRKASSRLRSQPPPVAAPPALAGLSFEMLSGKPCPAPAISLLVIEPDSSAGAVAEWAGGQTTSSYEIVCWDRDSGDAAALEAPDRKWRAGTLRELCQGLAGRYVCLASADLLLQSRTYLEENLFALEAEQLAFTMNVSWQAGWALQYLQQGLLPGSVAQPLSGLVVRKDCLAEGFALDLSAWLDAGGKPQVVAGKLIRHLSSHADKQDTPPFESRLDGFETRLDGVYLLARRKSDLPWGSQVHFLKSLEATFPPEHLPSDLPTALVVFPFLAVGGAEQIHLKVMQHLKERMRFVLVTYEALDPDQGTTANAFRELTPYVYTLPEFLHPSLFGDFTHSLIRRFEPQVLYIANGATWIYNALGDLKERYPAMRIVDQVYDAKVGWINRYDLGIVLHIDGFIGVNSKICQAYQDKGAIPAQVHLIENGIQPDELDPSQYDPARIASIKQRLGLPGDRRIVTFASRLHPQKRPMDFVELSRRFAGDPTVAFLMVGDGPLAGQVGVQIVKSNLKHIYRHDFYRPISDILAVSDVFVLPSEFEGMPMVIIEAQAMGKPVVVTDVGNNRDVIEYTQGGVIVPQVGDVSALAAGVRRMLDNPPDPARLRQTVLASFDIAIVAEKYYQVLLGNPHA